MSDLEDPDDPEAAGESEAPEATEERETVQERETLQEPETPTTTGASEDTGEEETGGIYCNECGRENPSNANYCSQCGSALEPTGTDSGVGTRSVKADLPNPASESSTSEPRGTEGPEDEKGETDIRGRMTWQILSVVGTAVGLVLIMFFVTQWSQTRDWGTSGTTSDQERAAQSGTSTDGEGGPSATRGGATMESGPQSATSEAQPLSALVDELGTTVDGPLQTEIDSLRSELQGAEGGRRPEVQADLVRLYTGAGAPGRAALVQSKIAESTGAVEDQRRTADLLYKWMRNVEADGKRSRIADVAQHVAESYESVVAERPNDLDAQTRMGEAYLLTSNPMKGIKAINGVLDADSTFVPARFQKGLALLQIGRLDEAVRQFEKVMEFTGENDPFYQQAKRAITVIRKKSSESESGSSPRSK